MRKSLSTVLASLFLVSLLWSQDVHPVTGRHYAGTMSVAGAPWLVRPERETEEHPDEALDFLKIQKGAVVADIGAGVGYMSWRLADRVGPSGKVYANDIQPQMIELLKKNIEARHLSNVEPVLGGIDDPKLPRARVDLVLMVDVYHELSQPQMMLRHIRESLKPAGRLVLLEYRAEDPGVPIQPLHKMSVAQAKAEIEPEGFQLAQVIEKLPWQHILIFQPKPI